MIGTVLRIRYELLQELPSNPIFAIYRAKDRVAGREVTLKLLRQPFATEPAFVERLRDVVRKVYGASFPGVERIIDMDEDGGVPFLVCEPSAGMLLSERIRKLAPLSPPVAVATASSVCEALLVLHDSNIVHGDVRPDNVSVQSDNSCRMLMAGVWEAYSSSRTAGLAMLPDMAPYLAPEITAGQMPSFATDLYAVGVVMVELLTARTPFAGDTPASIAQKHSTAPIPSLRALNAAIPPVLEEIVRKAMAKSPADRYHSARVLLHDLRSLQDAMRFGRQIGWPIRHQEEVPAPHAVSPRLGSAGPSPSRQERLAADMGVEGHVPSAPEVAKPWYEKRSMGAVDAHDETPPTRAPKTPVIQKNVRSIEPEPYDGVPKWFSAIVYLAVVAFIAGVFGWFYFFVTKPKLLVVPNLRGLKIAEASNRLSAIGLTMRKIKEQPSEKYPEDTILETRPSDGQQIREGAPVSVVVSSGSKFIEVPDLRGKTVDDAKSLLEGLNLEVDSNIRKVRDRNIEPGLIVAQLPEPRRKIERFSKVKLTVSSEQARSSSPPLVGSYNTYRLRVRLPKGDLPIVVRVDMTDDVETRTVYEQRQEPGGSFTVEADGQGKEAIFKIFFDGELVKQVTAKADDSTSRRAPSSNDTAGEPLGGQDRSTR